MDLDLKKSPDNLPQPEDLINQRIDINEEDASIVADWIPPVEGVDPYEHSMLKVQLGTDRVDNIDKWLKKIGNGEELIEKYGTEGVYHAINITGGDVHQTKKLLQDKGGDYAAKQLAKKVELPVHGTVSSKKPIAPQVAKEYSRPAKQLEEVVITSEYTVHVVENNQSKGYSKQQFTDKINAGEFDNKSGVKYITSDEGVLDLVETYAEKKNLEMKVEYTPKSKDPELVDVVEEVVNGVGSESSSGGLSGGDVTDLPPFDPKKHDQNNITYRNGKEYTNQGGEELEWDGIEWRKQEDKIWMKTRKRLRRMIYLRKVLWISSILN